MGIASERPLTNLVYMGMGEHHFHGAQEPPPRHRRGLRPASGAGRAQGAGGMKYAALLIAAACAQPRPIPPPPSRDWPLAKIFEAYLAADERLALRIDAPAGALRVNCGITGEGAYAHVEVRRAGEIVARGMCGDNIDARDLPAGPVTVVLLVLSAPGELHLVADAIGPEALSVQGDPPEQELFAALQRRDAQALDALLMNDFSFTAVQVLDKPAFIAAALRDPPFESFELRDVQVHAHGDSAAVTLTADLRGGPVLGVTDTWIREAGRWRLLARQQRRVEQ
ncbi:MAG TPA: nuclear transport factor 2 family protein [Myxococcales bacterium]|nr:nuclear transport factor 2 family protein [Myxococcales bacterium]